MDSTQALKDSLNEKAKESAEKMFEAHRRVHNPTSEDQLNDVADAIKGELYKLYDTIEQYDTDKLNKNIKKNLLPGLSKGLIALGKALSKEDVQNKITSLVTIAHENTKQQIVENKTLLSEIRPALIEFFAGNLDRQNKQTEDISRTLGTATNFGLKHPGVALKLQSAKLSLTKFMENL